jgi:predicted acylesterase/phospholipase RssA
MHLENIWLEKVAADPHSCGNGIFRVQGDPSDYLNVGCWLSPMRLLFRLFHDGTAIGQYCLGRSANFFASNQPPQSRLAGLLNVGSLIDNTPYSTLLRSVVHEQNIKRSKKKITIVATNWVTGTPERFRNSQFHDGKGIDLIMASTAIPGIFPPVRIGSQLFVDGAATENTPLSPAINSGAAELHTIYLDPHPKFIPLLAEPNTLDTMLRVYHVMLTTKLNEDIETAKWINQGLSLISTLREARPVSASQAAELARVVGQIAESDIHYKPITIHRYFPKASFPGRLGILDFTRDSIVKLIQEGEKSALLHNCVESNCLLSSVSESSHG